MGDGAAAVDPSREAAPVAAEVSAHPCGAPHLSGLHTALALLQRYGFVRIEGVPHTEAATEAACRRIGALKGTLYGSGMWRTEVLPGGGNDTAYTGIELRAHTDGCYMSEPPGLQVFHCLKAAADGGDTLLVDGLRVAAYLQATHPDTFAFFCAVPLPYHHTDPEHMLHAWHRVFTVEEGSGSVCGMRFNNDDRAPLALPWLRQPAGAAEPGADVAARPGSPADSAARAPHDLLAHAPVAGGVPPSQLHMPAVYRHLRRLLGAVRMPQHELWMSLRPGTMLVFDNQRVLHGRSAFSGDSGRILSGCYIGRDEWHSRFRTVSRELGLHVPAQTLR